MSLIKASPVKELCFSTSSKTCRVLAAFTQGLVVSVFSIWLRFELGIYEANFNFTGINSASKQLTLCLFLLSVATRPNVPLPSFPTISANRTGVFWCLLCLQNRDILSPTLTTSCLFPQAFPYLFSQAAIALQGLFTFSICYTCQLYYFETSSALSQTWTCHQLGFWFFWISSSFNWFQ